LSRLFGIVTKKWPDVFYEFAIVTTNGVKQIMAHIYIIYNADSSALGKIKYACNKIMSSSSSPPCPACDLTHNGLHLTETAQWFMTKQRIDGAEVQQLHRDELSTEVSKGSEILKSADGVG
jgi:hypothetical protein